MQETRVRSLGRENPLEKEMAIHSSILALRIPWTEKPSRLQSTGLQRVGHNWATSPHLTSFTDKANPVAQIYIITVGVAGCMRSAASVVSSSFRLWTIVTRLFCPWDFPGKSTGVGCHFLLQEIFQTQGLNPGLLHYRQTLYHLSHQGSPTLEYQVIIIAFV